MKLRIMDRGKGKEIDVRFWSFAKCQILVQLTLAGITYAILIIILLLWVAAR